MYYRRVAALAWFITILSVFDARAQQDGDLVRQFLATVTPPGARITLGAVESGEQGVRARDVVVLAESDNGEEFVQRIGSLLLQGLRARPDGLFTADKISAENIHINAAAEVQMATLSASGVDGARIDALALSDVRIITVSGNAGFEINIGGLELKDIDASTISAAAMGSQAGANPSRLEDALLNAALNTHNYSSLAVHALKLRKAGAFLLSAVEFGVRPDGAYAPFPASGNMFARAVEINLRDPMLADIRRALGQDELRFDFNSQHSFNAPGKHRWNSSVKLAPDGVLTSVCAADNLSAFSLALIRQAQAASTVSAVLRRCDISFTGNEFINRWLAQDGAKDGLSADQARGKYLALALYAPLDPQLSANPLMVEFAKAAQIFLSQPSRLDIRIAPEGGLKFPEGLMPLALLFQGSPEQKSQAAHQLGISLNASPL